MTVYEIASQVESVPSSVLRSIKELENALQINEELIDNDDEVAAYRIATANILLDVIQERVKISRVANIRVQLNENTYVAKREDLLDTVKEIQQDKKADAAIILEEWFNNLKINQSDIPTMPIVLDNVDLTLGDLGCITVIQNTLDNLRQHRYNVKMVKRILKYKLAVLIRQKRHEAWNSNPMLSERQKTTLFYELLSREDCYQHLPMKGLHLVVSRNNRLMDLVINCGEGLLLCPVSLTEITVVKAKYNKVMEEFISREKLQIPDSQFFIRSIIDV